MLIKFHNIKIENFFSFKSAEIVLNENGYTFINGVNRNPDDSAKSNGSGKSSIFEAISWCLTGDTIRDCKDIVNIYSDDGALVELNFEIDENQYTLIRSKDHSKYKTNLKIFINGEDKSGKGIRDSSKILEEIIPDLNSALLGSVIILGQGLPQKFSNNSPSGRKEVLEKLSKSDFMIEDLKNRIINRKSSLSTSLRAYEDSILKLETTKDLLNKQIKENEIKLESIQTTKDIDDLIDMLESSVLDCTIKINTNEGLIKELSDEYALVLSEKEQKDLTVKSLKENLTNNLCKLNEFSAKLAKEKEALVSRHNEEINKYYSSIVETKSIIQAKTTECNKLKSVKDICPTCGQKLPGVFKPDCTELEKNILELTEKLHAVEEMYNEVYAKANTEQKDFIEAFNTAHVAPIQLEIDTIQKEISKESSEVSKIELQLRNIYNELNQYTESSNVLKNKIQQYKDRMSSAKIEKESISSRKQQAEDIIAENKNKILDVDNQITSLSAESLVTKKRIEIVNKMERVITRDFRGYLLTNIIDFINKKAKEYCLDVFATDKIDFKLDGNNISIYYDGKDLSCLSGGEQQKVNLIIQFAIRDMLCKYLNFSSNILVLDEICDNVDSAGAEKLFNMISKKLSDAQSIYIISHHASDLQIPFDNIITVIKDENKLSRVTYGTI